MAEVTLTGVTKRYGDAVAVRGVDLAVADGEFVTLLGPSGCGKTTTLHMVAGLIPPTSGVIAIGGRVVADAVRGRFVPPNKRNLGMVFQSYALWPHMTLAANIGYPLKLRRVPPQQRAARVHDLLSLVALDGLAERYPHELSGGQQQRGALARALVGEPDILLLDEPLSNLDAKLREELRAEIRRVQQSVGTTVLFVTHDQDEAMALSDRVAVMRAGAIEQVGTPRMIYEQPATRFVAAFVGAVNLLDAVDDSGATRVIGAPDLVMPLAPPAPSFSAVIRPEDIALTPDAGGASGTVGEIASRTYLGDHASYMVRVGTLTLRVTAPKTMESEPGAAVRLVVLHATALPVVQEEGDGTARASGPFDLPDVVRAIY
ncbi:MAG: ABC transporter ATP-binding protein [Chloroflexota bacterium]|nr:ABC transporter ATP-binding protein [Chloroflexota bacterium]MDQ6905594.1 ABC transporter ATP-binding protein [Chloroflexota bacterium]